jgi:hypothetical protein
MLGDMPQVGSPGSWLELLALHAPRSRPLGPAFSILLKPPPEEAPAAGGGARGGGGSSGGTAAPLGALPLGGLWGASGLPPQLSWIGPAHWGGSGGVPGRWDVSGLPLKVRLWQGLEGGAGRVVVGGPAAERGRLAVTGRGRGGRGAGCAARELCFAPTFRRSCWDPGRLEDGSARQC